MLFRKGAFFIDSNLTLRQLQRWFGRVALALTVTFAVTQLLSYGTVLAWSACFGQVDYTTLMVLNDATIYLPCLVLIPLLLRGIPRADPIPDAALSGQEGFLALMFSLGSGYLFSYGTIALVSLLERLLGQTSTNVVSNIESALPPLASVLAFAVVAPVAEEFIFRRLLLAQAVAPQQPGDGFRLLHVVQIPPLEVLDQRQQRRVLLVHPRQQTRHLPQPGDPRRPPAALPRHQLVHASLLPDGQGLQNAVGGDAGRQLLQALRVEPAAGLLGIGSYVVDGHIAHAAG